MKHIILILTILAIATGATASQFIVSLSITNDSTTIMVNSKVVTRDEAKLIFQNIGELDKDLSVYVAVDGNVTAAALIEIINDIQSSKLHALVLTSQAEANGKNGWYAITVDCAKRPFGGCVGGYTQESGFQESPEYYLEEVKEAPDSQQSGPAYPPQGVGSADP